MSNLSKNLIIFDPYPTYEIPIAKSYLNKIEKWGDPIQIQYSDWMSYIAPTKDFLRNVDRENIIFIETENFFCNIFENNKCNASTETQIFYTDTNHLTFEGALFLTDHLGKLIINIERLIK